mmetsp:Transcript_12684/g.19172  ORF Transcript_12684/g.19172 Transcript_12684/m.19172 type:complete len:810 (-) Transcript_12684:27-2456(-)
MFFGSKWVLNRDSDDEFDEVADAGENKLFQYSDDDVRLSCSDDDLDIKQMMDSSSSSSSDLGDVLASPQTEQVQPVEQQQQKSGFLNKILSSFSSKDAQRSAPPPKPRGQRQKQYQNPRRAPKPRPPKPQRRVQKVRRATTNVVTLDLGSLASEANMMTGDPEKCENQTCGAFFSSNSVIEKRTVKPADAGSSNAQGSDETRTFWKCEYCSHEQEVFLDDDEVPKNDTVDYILAAPTSSAKSAAAANTTNNQVIFVLDTSGSMCVTSSVQGNHKLKNAAKTQASQFSQFMDGSDQLLPGEQTGVTWVSRLQCCQAAISDQITRLADESPNTRVGLITFSNDVVVYGDGLCDPTHIAGSKLNDRDQLFELGEQLANKMNAGVKETQPVLDKRIFSLSEEGATALCPALIVAIGQASQSPGSRIILCTDGRANVGLGSLENLDDDGQDKVAELYQDLGLIAAKNGTSVSVLSIKGTDCKLENIGALADATGGSVNIVEPENLTKEFASILDEEVIATNTTVKVLAHRAIYLVDAENDATLINTPDRSPQDHKKMITVGPVTPSTTVSFSYGIRRKKKTNTSTNKDVVSDVVSSEKKNVVSSERKAVAQSKAPAPAPSQQAVAASSAAAAQPVPDDIDISALKQIPFQVQIEFTHTKSGVKRLRVISKVQNVTNDRDQAEKDANIEVLSNVTNHMVANMAQEGHYSESRLHAFQNKNFLKRVAQKKGGASHQHYQAYKQKAWKLETALCSAQVKEQQAGLNLSDDDDDDFGGMNAQQNLLSSAPARRVSKKKSARSRNRNDRAAKVLFALKK